MKGPGLRITHDVRRLFTCPACGRKLKLPGHMVSRMCDCKSDGVWMQMREVRKVSPPKVEVQPAPVAVPDEEAVEETTSQPIVDTLVVEEQPAPNSDPPTKEAPTAQTSPTAVADVDQSHANQAQPTGGDKKPEESPKGETSSSPGEKRPRKKRQRKRRRKGKGGGGGSQPPAG